MKTQVRYPFLSDEWFDALEELRPVLPEVPEQFRDAAVNVTVPGGPAGTVRFHFVGGTPGRGHSPGAPTEVVVPYALARAMLIDGDLKAALAGFLTGKLLVKGDLTGLLGVQAMAPDLDDLTAENASLLTRIRDLTAEDR